MPARTLSRLATTGLGLALSVSLFSACAGTGGDDHLVTVGFAVPAEANNAVQRQFDELRGEEGGPGGQWPNSYGPSGDQSRAVTNGLPADFVHFSIEPDLERLVEADVVADDWDAGPNRGMLTDSVVSIVVREGNPKNITDWEDLARDDVRIVTPNPGSSGAARWNILAVWASAIQAGGTEADAEAFLSDVIANVDAFPGSGRDATTAFLDGTGDVLLSYENEAILGRQHGQSFDYITPDRNLLIENPAAVTTRAPESAREFLDFALSPAGQQIYVEHGFRPLRHVADEVDTSRVEGVADPSDPFPEITDLWTIDENFGGWDAVVDKYFDTDGVITAIIERSGLE